MMVNQSIIINENGSDGHYLSYYPSISKLLSFILVCVKFFGIGNDRLLESVHCYYYYYYNNYIDDLIQ